MKFTDFLNIYGNTDNCKTVARNMPFDQEVVSLAQFGRLYHKAVRLGLIPADAVVFKDTFNVDIDFNLDTPEDVEQYMANAYVWPWQRGEVWP